MCSEFLTWFPSQQSDATEIMMTTVAGIVMIALAIGICIGAVFYVVQALAMYQMATRRKISNPWLAWVPVGNLWILGSLSDQYAYLTQARNQRRRILMPVLKAVCVVASILSISLRPFVNAHIIPHGGTFPYGIYTLVGSIASVVYVGTSVAYLIYYCICLYNIYRSCDPSTATVYLVISILFPVACPFLLLSSRKHEMGMPPRRDQAFGGNPRSYAPGGNYQSGPYAPGGNYQSGPYAPGGNYQSGPYMPPVAITSPAPMPPVAITSLALTLPVAITNPALTLPAAITNPALTLPAAITSPAPMRPAAITSPSLLLPLTVTRRLP